MLNPSPEFAGTGPSGAMPVEAPGFPPAPVPLGTDPGVPRALFAISSLGLGHASRSLAVIRAYLERGYALTIVSSAGALAFLRLELADAAAVRFVELPDYPALERGSGWRLYAYLALDLLRTWRLIRAEHRWLQPAAAGFDFVFSDGRYGFYSRWAPSFVLSHQIAFVPPRGLREASWLTEHVNIAALRRFDCLLIPDFPCPSANLAGHLAHSRHLHRCRHRYLGILSSYRHLPLAQDIDYLFVISGYLLEHKQGFVRSLLEQARALPGRKVFVLGAPGQDAAAYAAWQGPDLEIHPVASGELRQALFGRARVVVSRAGYSTVMDLVEHGKRAVLVPTPNQTEQEYLAQYLEGQGYFVARRQGPELDLAAALEACAATRPFPAPWGVADSLRRLGEEIEPMLYRHYFSIVVPAHDEEKEIEATLRCLLEQDYPAERYEIVVVENGSSDRTFEFASAVARTTPGRISVLQSARGVSRARNTGIDALAAESEWVVLCDADTRLGPFFLRQLNTWLLRHGSGVSVATTAVRPIPPAGLYARAWFGFYDLVHRVSASSFALQVARTSVARGVRFREDLALAEDLLFISECRRYGRFAFIPSDQVSTSTRRFERFGYLRQGLRWLFQALLPLRLKSGREYRVVR